MHRFVFLFKRLQVLLALICLLSCVQLQALQIGSLQQGTLQQGIDLLNQNQIEAAWDFFRNKFDQAQAAPDNQPSIDLALYYCQSQLEILRSPVQHFVDSRYDMLSILPSVIEQAQDPQKIRKAQFILANYYARLGLAKQASQLYQQLLEQDPQDPELWLAIADNYGRRADQEGIFKVYSHLRQAREAYSNALKLAPTFPDILWQISRFTASADPAYGGNKRQALKYLNLLEEHSDDYREGGTADNKRAQIYQQLGRKNKALSYISQAMEKEIDFYNTLYAIRINAEFGYHDRAQEMVPDRRSKLNSETGLTGQWDSVCDGDLDQQNPSIDYTALFEALADWNEVLTSQSDTPPDLKL
jgi:tetratricopeptide (TPR) repeat protein